MKPIRHKLTGMGELHPLRIGRFTASIAGALFSKPSTKTYKDMIARVAFERITGKKPEGGFEGNYWTARGHELEPFAVEQYEIDTFSTVHPGDFWTLGDWYGASPDGLIEPNGIFEGKAPKHTTHIQYLIANRLPSEYKWQPVMQMYVLDRDWVDFQSYHPDLAPFRIRVERDATKEAELVGALLTAQEQVESMINEIKEAA